MAKQVAFSPRRWSAIKKKSQDSTQRQTAKDQKEGRLTCLGLGPCWGGERLDVACCRRTRAWGWHVTLGGTVTDSQTCRRLARRDHGDNARSTSYLVLYILGPAAARGSQLAAPTAKSTSTSTVDKPICALDRGPACHVLHRSSSPTYSLPVLMNTTPRLVTGPLLQRCRLRRCRASRQTQASREPPLTLESGCRDRLGPKSHPIARCRTPDAFFFEGLVLCYLLERDMSEMLACSLRSVIWPVYSSCMLA